MSLFMPYKSKITKPSPFTLLALTICLRCSALCSSPCLHLLSAFCGYVTVPGQLQRGKRKRSELPSVPPPAKSSFRSTECLLLSLLRQGSCDETESPMREVLSGTIQSRLAASGQDETTVSGSQLGGSCTSLSTVLSTRPHRRSCSLETILDTSIPVTRQQLFLSMDSLASCSCSSNNQDDSPTIKSQQSCSDSASVVKTNSVIPEKAPGVTTRKKLPVHMAQKSSSLRPNSVGSCLDIVRESRGNGVKEIKCQSRATSCLNVNNPASQQLSALASHAPLLSSYLPTSSSHHFSLSTATTKAQGSNTATEPSGPTPASSTSNLWPLPAPAVVRRCFSSLDVSKLPRPVSLLNLPVCVPARNFQLPQPKHEHSKTVSPLPVCLLPNYIYLI